MNTLKRFQGGDLAIPASTAWYLSDLGEFRGKQELYTRQSPQRLKVLREHAMVANGYVFVPCRQPTPPTRWCNWWQPGRTASMSAGFRP